MTAVTAAPPMTEAFWAEHRAQLLAHWLKLFDSPAFGVAYVRRAVEDYLAEPGCPFPRIGHDFKDALDGRDTAKTA